ncbi:MAG: hypothetical protein U9M98_02920 [Patescibacteria group bacterium]|nr:hypothetical protein [Patescibacteria group bacterium]
MHAKDELGKVFFEYPTRSYVVYALSGEGVVDEAYSVVRLPEGDILLLMYAGERSYLVVHDVLELAAPPSVRGKPCAVWEASLVIGPGQGVQAFPGEWTAELIEKMEAAAYVNNLFYVVFTLEEYQVLENGGLEELKERLTPNLAHRLHLFESYPTRGVEEEPTLLVCRHGRCPH